ncbi:hypothetical protein D1641_01175 [Colidextribacter sp. OB.20]|uniref:PcfJ domain-containing protein n=1 Tax=Colidextribacter sp. OB.20 TaxID=2304568 RepID=UPI001368D313|nr:PcfJ domain-containing protein [Colidextribacter sp. OB.20]NBI08631.1 hypothetical protein [Colidextribacter sp. OB.20]
MAKCNVDAIAGAELLSRFQAYLTGEEEEQVKERFTGLCFYETFGRRDYRECCCTKCEQTFSVEKDEDKDFFKAHHNDYVTCPACREEVQLKSLGRIRNFSNLRETIPAVFLRADKEGALLISAGLATRKIPGWNDLTPWVDWTEKARYYLAPGRVMGWKRSIDYYFGMIMGPQPWTQMKNICKPFQNNPYRCLTDHYWLFGLEALERSKFRYCQINEWYRDVVGCWLEEDNKVRLCIEFLAEYALHPQMELAVKLGLTDAVTDLCEGKKNHQDLNWQADKPWDFFRLSKADAKAFLAAPSLTLLHWIHEEQRAGAELLVRDMIRLWSSFGGAQAKKLASCTLRCKVSPQKAERYVLSVLGPIAQDQAAELWYDYLDMAGKLGYDLNREDVLMPKDLRARHDAAAQTIQAEEDKKQSKAYAKRLEELRKKYEFELDGLRVVVPENARQIVEEGRILKHCVGGYAGRHIQGKTTILFLRRSRRPERSYVTIEMTGAGQTDIMQIHGYRNEHYRGGISPRDQYEHFLSVWKGWLKAGSRRDRQGRPVLPQEQKAGVA